MDIPHPPIATREEWLEKRRELLAKEKALTRQKDKLAAERRRLPMVPVDKQYTFQTEDGPKTLQELFGGSPQLVVYHFMFDPTWDKGCPGCTSYIDALGPKTREEIKERNTEFVMVSRAPLDKLLKYKQEQGWPFTWVSSHGSDFNYDFNVTQDASVKPVEYNFYVKDDQTSEGEAASISSFFKVGDKVYHTYQTYARGTECTTDGYGLLDLTPYGRQEDWEDSPEGWPQKPTYG